MRFFRVEGWLILSRLSRRCWMRLTCVDTPFGNRKAAFALLAEGSFGAQFQELTLPIWACIRHVFSTKIEIETHTFSLP